MCVWASEWMFDRMRFLNSGVVTGEKGNMRLERRFKNKDECKNRLIITVRSYASFPRHTPSQPRYEETVCLHCMVFLGVHCARFSDGADLVLPVEVSTISKRAQDAQEARQPAEVTPPGHESAENSRDPRIVLSVALSSDVVQLRTDLCCALI